MKTISFDFDFTLWDEDKQNFISETFILLREFISGGHRVIITTSRIQKWIPEVKEKLKSLGLELEIFSAPGNFEDVERTEPCKSDILVRENVSIHFDDLAEVSLEFTFARNNGVEVKLPPAIVASSSGGGWMY